MKPKARQRVTAKTRHQWRSLVGVPTKRIAQLWGVHPDTVSYHLHDAMAAHRREQWRIYKHRINNQLGASK